MNYLSDTDYIINISKGNEAAFNNLFDNYYQTLCLFCYRFVPDMDKCRSIVQQVFVNIWLDHQKLNVKGTLKAYLYRAVRNAAIDYLRHRKIESAYLDSIKDNELEESTIQEFMENAEIDVRINKAIESLPEQMRKVFILSKLEGKKYSEIAEVMDISVKTVEMHMSNALKKLRTQLSDLQFMLLLVHKK